MSSSYLPPVIKDAFSPDKSADGTDKVPILGPQWEAPKPKILEL